jgi:hypothetical protein
MTRKLHSLLAAAATAGLLAACGGHGDDDAPAEDPSLVPTSATASVGAWITFAKALMSSDSSEALSLTNVNALPTSETEEGQSVGP